MMDNGFMYLALGMMLGVLLWALGSFAIEIVEAAGLYFIP